MYNSDVKITISKDKLSCNDVINSLKKCKIQSNVINTQSIICDKNKCWNENACIITLVNKKDHNKINDMWKTLKENHNLECANLEVKNLYSGCIKNYNKFQSNDSWNDVLNKTVFY